MRYNKCANCNKQGSCPFMQFDEEARVYACPYIFTPTGHRHKLAVLNVSSPIRAEWKEQINIEQEYVPLGLKRHPYMLEAAAKQYDPVDKIGSMDPDRIQHLGRIWLN